MAFIMGVGFGLFIGALLYNIVMRRLIKTCIAALESNIDILKINKDQVIDTRLDYLAKAFPRERKNIHRN